MATMLMPGRTFIINNVKHKKVLKKVVSIQPFFAVLKTYRMARLEDFHSNTQLCLLVESCFILSSGFRITGKTTNIPKIRIYKIDDYVILLWVPVKHASGQ